MRHPDRPTHRRRGQHRRLAAVAAVLLGTLCLPAVATPFVPQGDDQVVETLPRRLDTPAQRRAQREARAQLQREPAQLPLALGLARQAIDRARQQGDPRELGQAQAALAPWWGLSDPPPAVRLLRATVRQSQHDFGEALRDLDALVSPAPSMPAPPLAVQAQAELTRAAVLQVLGRWPEAQAGCERLQGPRYAALGEAARRPAQACLAELRSLQGQADAAARTLQALARNAPQGEAAWLALLQAELAERRGDAPAAQAFYRAATQGQPEVYSLAARADWLLAQQRPAEAARLLEGREDTDALLLRLAIAWKRTADARADTAIATLQARFEEAAQRGDTAHARERARFELDLRQRDPAAALREAQANWARQKEPADALLLVRAALAAQRPEAARPVWDFVQATGLHDARLARLHTQLRETQP